MAEKAVTLAVTVVVPSWTDNAVVEYQVGAALKDRIADLWPDGGEFTAATVVGSKEI